MERSMLTIGVFRKEVWRAMAKSWTRENQQDRTGAGAVSQRECAPWHCKAVSSVGTAAIEESRRLRFEIGCPFFSSSRLFSAEYRSLPDIRFLGVFGSFAGRPSASRS